MIYRRLALICVALSLAAAAAAAVAWALGALDARPNLVAPLGRIGAQWVDGDVPPGVLRAGSSDAPLLVVREDLGRPSTLFGPDYEEVRRLIEGGSLRVRYVPLGDADLPLLRYVVCTEAAGAWRLLEWYHANPEAAPRIDGELLERVLTYEGFDVARTRDCLAGGLAPERIGAIALADPFGRLPRYALTGLELPPGVAIREALDRIFAPKPSIEPGGEGVSPNGPSAAPSDDPSPAPSGSTTP